MNERHKPASAGGKAPSPADTSPAVAPGPDPQALSHLADARQAQAPNRPNSPSTPNITPSEQDGSSVNACGKPGARQPEYPNVFGVSPDSYLTPLRYDGLPEHLWEVHRQVMKGVWRQELEDLRQMWLEAQETGVPFSVGRVIPVRNGDWNLALNLAADEHGILQRLIDLQNELQQLPVQNIPSQQTGASTLLEESLGMLSNALTVMACPPDKYPSKAITYEVIKADILSLWGQALSKIQRDLERAQQIGERLQEMFAAFESGDLPKGQDIALELWGSNVIELR